MNIERIVTPRATPHMRQHGKFENCGYPIGHFLVISVKFLNFLGGPRGSKIMFFDVLKAPEHPLNDSRHSKKSSNFS